MGVLHVIARQLKKGVASVLGMIQRPTGEYVGNGLEERESGCLPNTFRSQFFKQTPATRERVAVVYEALAKDVVVRQVFDAAYAGICRFLDLHSLRNVPREGSPSLSGLKGNGEEGFARSVIVNLDEVDARLLQVGDRFPGLLRVGHPAAIRVAGRSVVQYGTCRNDFRAQSRAGPDALAQRQDKIDVPAHIASSNDSFCDE